MLEEFCPCSIDEFDQLTTALPCKASLASEQERYIHLLEKDLEAVRGELRQAASAFVR